MLRQLCVCGVALGAACLSDPRPDARGSDPAPLQVGQREPAPPQAPAAASASEPAPPRAQDPAPQARAALDRAFVEQGVRIDLERGVLGLACNVGITRDLLEYLLVGPGGSGHESLLLTNATPSLVNAGLLMLGVERGADVRWTRRDPPPTDEERAAGVKPYKLELPQGDGFYLYLGWRRAEETYLLRVEDLIVNLRAEAAMERHRWVYTGSHFAKSSDGREVFAADAARNLISIVFFPEGDVFAAAALADCVQQTIWIANPWLVPAPGSPVELFFSRRPLVELPPGWGEQLPRVGTIGAASAELSSEAPVPAQGGQR